MKTTVKEMPVNAGTLTGGDSIVSPLNESVSDYTPTMLSALMTAVNKYQKGMEVNHG